MEKHIREDDRIHLSEAGIAVAAELVESVIRAEVEKLPAVDKRADSATASDVGAPV